MTATKIVEGQHILHDPVPPSVDTDRCPLCEGEIVYNEATGFHGHICDYCGVRVIIYDNEWSCSGCGERLHGETAEVVNKTTGARSVQHAECYLADQDCYELA